MSNNIEMEPDSQAFSKDLETVITHDEDVKPSNGLAAHTEAFQTREEIKAEKHFVLKVDLMILPLLVLSVFLASLVCKALHLYEPGKLDHAMTPCLGSWRYWICLQRRNGEGA